MTGRDIHDVVLRLAQNGAFRTSRLAPNGSLYVGGIRVGDVLEFRHDGHRSGKSYAVTVSATTAPAGNRAQRRRA